MVAINTIPDNGVSAFNLRPILQRIQIKLEDILLILSKCSISGPCVTNTDCDILDIDDGIELPYWDKMYKIILNYPLYGLYDRITISDTPTHFIS